MSKYDELVMHERRKKAVQVHTSIPLHTIDWKDLTPEAVGIVEKERKIGAKEGQFTSEWYPSPHSCFYIVQTEDIKNDILPQRTQ